MFLLSVSDLACSGGGGGRRYCRGLGLLPSHATPAAAAGARAAPVAESVATVAASEVPAAAPAAQDSEELCMAATPAALRPGEPGRYGPRAENVSLGANGTLIPVTGVIGITASFRSRIGPY